jgi:hypothetical protein
MWLNHLSILNGRETTGAVVNLSSLDKSDHTKIFIKDYIDEETGACHLSQSVMRGPC